MPMPRFGQDPASTRRQWRPPAAVQRASPVVTTRGTMCHLVRWTRLRSGAIGPLGGGAVVPTEWHGVPLFWSPRRAGRSRRQGRHRTLVVTPNGTACHLSRRSRPSQRAIGPPGSRQPVVPTEWHGAPFVVTSPGAIKSSAGARRRACSDPKWHGVPHLW